MHLVRRQKSASVTVLVECRYIRTYETIENADSDNRKYCKSKIPEEKVGIFEGPNVLLSSSRFAIYIEALLLGTPSTIKLEPPKDTDVDDILIEEVEDPEMNF